MLWLCNNKSVIRFYNDSPTLGNTNLSHDGLNPAHVLFWRVHKSDAWRIQLCNDRKSRHRRIKQASYPCGNFSDTPCLKLKKTKGSIDHAFTVCIYSRLIIHSFYSITDVVVPLPSRSLKVPSMQIRNNLINYL